MADAVVGKSVAKRLLSFICAKTRDARAILSSVESSAARRMSLLVALLAAFPEFAYAMDYSTGTGLVRDFVSGCSSTRVPMSSWRFSASVCSGCRRVGFR